MQYYNPNEIRKQGVQIAQKYQKQGDFVNEQQQYQMREQQQKQQQTQPTSHENLLQFHNEVQQAQQMQMMSQQQIQMQQQQQLKQDKDDQQKQNQESDNEDDEKQKLELIKEQEHYLNKYFHKLKSEKRKPNDEECGWIMEMSLKLSIDYQNVGNKLLKQKRYKEADTWFMGSLQYTELKDISDEVVIGPGGEKMSRKETYKFEWFMQRISIANSIHALYKKRNKTQKIIEIIKKIVIECEGCQYKIKLQEHIQSNIENLYYHLAEYHLIGMSTSPQMMNQKSSQPNLGTQTNTNVNQPSLTNIAQQQQTNLMLQKNELEETIRYAKQCMNILAMKYHNISSKKTGDTLLLETISKVYLEKKQIMFIHVMYLIGRTLQWAEFYPESLSFYKQAYLLARAHFKKKDIHPTDGKDDLLLQYRLKIEQVIKIIQNDIDENMSPELFDKAFRDDLEVLQQGNDDLKYSQNNTKTLSLNLDTIQPFLLTTDFDDILQGFAPSHASLRSQGIGDQDNLNFFTDETLVESQILSQTGQGIEIRKPTEKSQKSRIRISTKQQYGKSQGLTQQERSQKLGTGTILKNDNILDMQKQLGTMQYKQTRKGSLNMITKESSGHGIINNKLDKHFSSHQTYQLKRDEAQSQQSQPLFQRKMSNQKTIKIGQLGYIDQENKVTQHLMENRTLKRVQGQQIISELADQIQLNYNNYMEFRKELSECMPQIEQLNDNQSQKGDIYDTDKKSQASYSQQLDFGKKQYSNKQIMIDPISNKQGGVKGMMPSISQSGLSSPYQLNTQFNQQQQVIQNSFNVSSTKKFLNRPLTSNTQLSTYRPSSSNRNQKSTHLNLRIFQEDNVFDNIIEQTNDELWNQDMDPNNSQIATNRNNTQDLIKESPQQPNSLVNEYFKYELLLRPSENKINNQSNDPKKAYQIKKTQYQIKINANLRNNYTKTNNSYQTIDEQVGVFKKLGTASGVQIPLRNSPNRIKSVHAQNQNKLFMANQKQKQLPTTSNAQNQGQDNYNQLFQDNLQRANFNIPQQEIKQGPSKRNQQYPFQRQQQQFQQQNSDQKNIDELNLQKQLNVLQKHKHSFEIFDDDKTYNFVQGFDLDKVISQRFDRLIADVDERNLKDRENSLQKLEYIGSDNKNHPQNQPTLLNDDDLFSEDGDRDAQDEKQQQDNMNNNKESISNQANQQAANADLNADKGYIHENEKISKEKEEYFIYKNREAKRIEEVYSFFQKVKPCRDRFLLFYQKFNQSVACLWKLEKFKIKFQVQDPHKEIASLANFNFKNKESLYKFTLSLHIESMFYSGKLLFTIQKNELDFLENFLYKRNIISRWGIADFILNEYFLLPKNQNLMNNWNSFYNLMEGGQSQLLISFNQALGRYQGSFQVQENIELMNVGIKLQFLVGQSLKLIRTPTGEKLKLIFQMNQQGSSTLNQIPMAGYQQSQGDDEDEKQQFLYKKNYLFLKEFLKVRRQIVRKTIINLEKMSPQIFIRFGIQKKVKQNYSPSVSPLNETQDSEMAKQYQRSKEYVSECKKRYNKNFENYQKFLTQNEEGINKNQPSNSPHIQKQQLDIISQRTRQKNSLPSIAQMGKTLKATNSFRNNLTQIQSPPNVSTILNIQQSINPANSVNPLMANSRAPHQQNSPNSTSSINDQKNLKQMPSRNNSIAQLSEYSGEIDNQGEMESPNDQNNNSMESSQSRQSIMRQNQGNSNNSNSQGKEDSRIIMRNESLRNREVSKSENKNMLDEDQNNQIQSGNQTQNPAIERFFLRNLNKKSTFSMIKKTEDQSEKGKENVDSSGEQLSINQQDDNQQEEIADFDVNRNESINLIPQSDEPATKGRSQKQIQPEFEDFVLNNHNSDQEDKFFNYKDMISFGNNYNQENNEPENIIQQFKNEINLSVESKSSEYDSDSDAKYLNDEEDESILNYEKRNKQRFRTHTKSSLENSQQYASMYPRLIPENNNQNSGSHDLRLLPKQIFNEDKMVMSEQMFSPRSYTDDNAQGDRDYNKQLTQMQFQQQLQENSIEAYQQRDFLRKRTDDLNDQDYDYNKMNLIDATYISFQQADIQNRPKEDSKNFQVNSEGGTNSTQNDHTLSIALRPPNQQQGSNTTIDEIINQKIENYRQIILMQEKIRFCVPLEYIQYFEENQNIAQIVVPNIFINAFRQKDLLLSGIMKLGSMSVSEYTRRKEGTEARQGGDTKNGKGEDGESENEDFGHLFQKYQRQQSVILDNSDKAYFFVTFSISFTQNAEIEWDIEKLKKDVLIHVDGIQLISEYSRDSLSRYSSTFSLFEFIDLMFPEDNDLATQEYYDTIQYLLKKAQGLQTNEDSTSEGIQQNDDDSILKEENFGLNVETLQNEGLYPFTDFNIKFQKSISNNHFKLNKFVYNIGFTHSQKVVIMERLNNQLVIVDEQLRLIPRRIKRFRLFSDMLYFIDDSKYSSIHFQYIYQKNLLQKQQETLLKKLGINSTTIPLNHQNSVVNSVQTIHHKSQQAIPQKKASRNENDEQNSEENQNSDSQQEQIGVENNKAGVIIEKMPISNLKISPMNSIDVDEIEVQMKNLQYKEFIQNIITSEKIFHLHQIFTREPPVESEYTLVLTNKQFEERQQAQSLELLENESLQENVRSQNKIANFTQTNEFRRESNLERSMIKSPQSILLQSSISQDVSLQQKKQRRSSILTSFNAQKLTKKLKKAIKSEFNNIRYVTKEERERNYNDGKINHPYAMMFYNSVLRVDSKNQNKIGLTQIQKRRGEERKILDNREAFRREEDVRIIDSIFSHKDGFRKKIKVEYIIDQDGELNSIISFYDPLSYRLEKVRVKEKKNLEKLQNLLQVNNYLLKNNLLRDILLKMNMKWSRKIIGRKLEFRSFIETNEDFFNYKLNRKKNPNDEALYKLMTTKNYLDESIKQFTNFLYKVKLALISNDQNAETAEQNYFFNTYFYSTRVQQFQKINNLGRALIQTTVYQSKLLYTTDNYVFIRIDITPATKRTKLIKMILDYNDIITIFQKTQYSLKNCLDPEAITKMVIEFAEKVNYSHTQNYNALKIPYWKQFNQISESSDYDLVNQFDFNSMNTKQEISFLSKKSMMTPVLRTLKIIYQGIKKINNQFLVITVKRYIYLNIDWFQLIIYIPKTSRRFICYMMESDMLKFDPDFMEQVIPLVIVKYESNINELKQSKNYFQFCETFDQMHRRLVQLENNDPYRKTEKKITYRSENWFAKSSEDISSQHNLRIKNKTSFMLIRGDHMQSDHNRISHNVSLQQIESLNDLRDSSLNSSQFRSIQGNPSKYASQRTNFVKYFQKNLTEQTSFLEKKVWEHLISAIIIEENLQHKLVLKINTFNGILRETLSSMVLNMNERDNILYEFYIEEHKKKTLHSIFLESRPIKLEDSFYQNLYIRINFFGQELVHNQKVCGRHMLFSYHKMARSKLKNKQIDEINQQKSSGSQVKISLNPSKQSEQKISSQTKISIAPEKPLIKNYTRTSIMEKKGQLILNPIGQVTKKATENTNRTSWANVQKAITDQVGAVADNPFLYSFILADMQEMAIFYANKIKANYNQFVKEREKKVLKGNIQDYLSLYKSKSLLKDSECDAILQPNKNFKRQKEIDPMQIKYFIIYRRILTLNPRQMITIFYKPDKQTFYMYSWNNINSKEVIIKKRLADIEKFIPHATQFLNTKLYKELGDRIYLCFKNQILLQTYKHLR